MNPLGEAPRDVTAPARTSRRFDLMSAALAFAIWGGWAYYVNSQSVGAETRASPLISGLTQGTGSFVITLVLVRAVAWLYHRLPANPLRLVLPGILTVMVTGTCLAIAHTLVGTADIARTIAPALSVAFAFCVFTAFKIRQAQGAGARHSTGGKS